MIEFYSPPVILLALLATFVAYLTFKTLRGHSIAYLPGPKPGPWHIGNLQQLFTSEPSHAVVSQWTTEYGPATRFKGPVGMDVLLLSDPKAMQYVLNVSGYNFVKPQQARVIARLLMGEGLLFHEGAEHSRQRRIMTPSFHFGTLRNFTPIFRSIARRAITKWNDIITHAGESSVVEITGWFSRITLDAIGEAGFDYKFGAIENVDNELTKVYRNLLSDSFYKRSDAIIIFEALCGYIPIPVVKALQSVLPTRQLKRLRRYMEVASTVAQRVIDTQTEAYLHKQEGGKDIMSILVRANISENPRTKLTEKHLHAQLTTFMFAGHETTSSTMSWALYELAIHPEHQTRLREEIKLAKKEAAARGDFELTVSDLDSMKFLAAIMKETLRLHPIAAMMQREAARDTVIPLSNPIRTTTGELITTIPVSKGQRLFLSVTMYNRIKSVWGEDADTWRPERFLEDMPAKTKTGLGVISNLGSFGSGVHSCIGWRFAMVEMQTLLIEFIENFEFSPTLATQDVIAGAFGTVGPMLKTHRGKAQLPLLVTPVQNCE